MLLFVMKKLLNIYEHTFYNIKKSSSVNMGLIERGDSVLIFHVDANSAYLSWTAAALLEEGFKKDIRKIPSAIAGDPENRHGIIFIAQYNYQKLQSEMENIASPKWRKLQRIF